MSRDLQRAVQMTSRAHLFDFDILMNAAHARPTIHQSNDKDFSVLYNPVFVMSMKHDSKKEGRKREKWNNEQSVLESKTWRPCCHDNPKGQTKQGQHNNYQC